MAMTLRLTDDDERELDELAKTLGTSRQRAILHAVRTTNEQLAHRNAVMTYSAQEATRYRSLLDRLGQ